MIPCTLQAELMCLDLFSHEVIGFNEHRFVLQENDYFCGPAILQAVLERQGVYLSQQELAKLAKTDSKEGTSPLQMFHVLKKYNMEVSLTTKLNLSQMKQLLREKKSLILLIDFEQESHWVVLDSFDGSQFKLLDPWFENNDFLYMSEKQLLAAWKTNFKGQVIKNLALVALPNFN
jgi:ABC-type bacteriocin/lantibiotic exporter with double-glycine peptidase domain